VHSVPELQDLQLAEHEAQAPFSSEKYPSSQAILQKFAIEQLLQFVLQTSHFTFSVKTLKYPSLQTVQTVLLVQVLQFSGHSSHV
jgi:hypothetical protein